MPTAITPLANITLSSSASTVTFSSISGSYRDLRLILQVNAPIDASVNVTMAINGTPTADGVYASGNGSTSASGTNNDTKVYFVPTITMSTGTNEPFMATVDFLDYSVSDKHKCGLMRVNRASNSNGGAAGSGMQAFRFSTTSAITSIVLNPYNGFAAGSTFALYGVSA